jgi:hypothetical protein
MVRANRLALRKFDGGDRPLSIVSPIEIRKPWNSSSQTFSTVPVFPSVRTTALPTSSDWASSNGLRIIDGLTSLKRPFADAFVLMPFGIPEKSTVMAKRIAARTCGTEQSALLADLEQRVVVRTIVVPGSVTSALGPLRMAKKLDPYRETARMALEPWLVEAALARLPQTLSPADQRTIVEATRTCACRNSNSHVQMMKSAKKWHRQNATNGMYCSRRRRVLVDRKVRASLVIVGRVRSQQMAEMPLAEHDNVVKTFPPDRTDRPFTISVLPRRSRRGWPIPNAHRPKAADEDVTVDGVAVTNDVSRCYFPTIGLGELVRNPFSRWVRSHPQPQDLAAIVMQ